MQRTHRIIHALNLVASSHFFCCVLPVAAKAVALGAGAGLFSATLALHARLHTYEPYLLMFSGLVFAVDFAAQYHASKVDCHDTGCDHPPCEPKKIRIRKFTLLAGALFFVNLAFFLAHAH
jgi:hypothetical protein